MLLLNSTSTCSKTEGSLKGVIDPPLETGQGSNHDDTGSQTLDHEVGISKLRGNGADGLALVLGLAEKGHNGVGRVGDDGADNSGNVTRGEGDSKLGGLGVGVTRSSKHVRVEQFHDLKKNFSIGAQN